MNVDGLKRYIRDIPDFPEPGVMFRDITPMLLNPAAFREVVDAFTLRYDGMKISKIVAIESRGFVFASPLAYKIGAGLIPLRKAGKLPFQTIRQAYELEYGEAALEIHNDAIKKGERVLLFDDLIATGGTAGAAVELIRKLGGYVVEAGFVIELKALRGREKLSGIPVFALVSYD